MVVIWLLRRPSLSLAINPSTLYIPTALARHHAIHLQGMLVIRRAIKLWV